MVSDLHDLRMICILKSVTSEKVANTVPFALTIDSFHFCGFFEIPKLNTAFPAFPPPPVSSPAYFKHTILLV